MFYTRALLCLLCFGLLLQAATVRTRSFVDFVQRPSSTSTAGLKRAAAGGSGPADNDKKGSSAAIGGQPAIMTRQPRGSRQYDVPQIECPPVEDGIERFACPTPDRMGRYRCIDDHVLCDGFLDCPNSEDEDRLACMFYKTTKAHLDVLADALLRWARGR